MKYLWTLSLSLFAITACATAEPPEVVDHVDVERYLGTWYEASSVPIRGQRGCVGTTATYGERDDGDISVYNRCYDGSFDGDVRDIEGKAWVADEETNAKLWVRFFWPFRSSYWIVALDDEDYQWAAVSDRRADNLWVLSRSPCMDQVLFDNIYADLKARDLPVDELESTLQRDDDGQECQVLLRAK